MNKQSAITPDQPEYEKRSLQKCLIRTLIFLGVGFFCGIFMVIITITMKKIFPHWESDISSLQSIQLYILPFILLVATIATSILNEVHFSKARKLIDTWDGEDEAHIKAVDHCLNQVIFSLSVMSIVSSMLFAIITYGLFSNIEDSLSKSTMTIIAVIFYLLALILLAYQQNKSIKMIKEYAPEKQGSVFDTKFKKVWLDSCDEWERSIIYEASYMTFQFTNKFLSILLTIATILGMFCHIGILCCILISVVWLVINAYYLICSMKLES